MEQAAKPSAFWRLFRTVSLGWRMAVLTLAFVLIKRKNQKLLTYRQDVFIHWLWRWQWRWSSTQQQWTISRLRAYCPTCQTLLTPVVPGKSAVLICPKGGRTHEKGMFGNPETVVAIKQLVLEKAANQFNLSER